MTPTHRASLAALNAYQADDAAERAARITDDVTWLLNAGEHPEQIAARLGMTLAALERYLYRHDRHDLARPFSRIRYQQRRQQGQTA